MDGAEIERVKKILKEFPKGITIAELAHQLGLNRISASKYLSMLLASGQAEMRIFGPSKVFYPSQRIPLSSILNFSTSHLLVMDDTFTIIDANEALLHFYSQKKEELIGKRIDYSPLAGYLDPAILQQVKRVMGSEAVTIEIRINLEGKEHVLQIKCIPTVFESGDHGLSLISEDITELTEYREHLEQLVEERAKDLLITNDRLKKEIASHKKARLGLKASEEKYRELVENANSIIVKTDLEGKILFFNEFAQHFFGYSESEIMGKSIYDTIVPENDQSGKSIREIREKMRLEMESYGPYAGDNLKKNGERVWIFWTHKSIRNSQGQITGILSIGSDITEQKRMEDVLKISEERFRFAMDASSEGLWDWDIKTGYVYLSPAYYRLFGYETDDFSPTIQTLFGFTHPDDMIRVTGLTKDCVEDRCQSFETEYRIKAKDGSWRWMLVRAKAVDRDNKGRARRIIGTFSDITERRCAEEALRISEERFRLAMDASNDGIWDYDITTDTCYVSPPFFRMLGYVPGEISIASGNWPSFLHPDDRDRTHSLKQDCYENRCQNFEIEYRVKAKNGSWKWILNRGKVCSRDPSGRALRIIGTHIDLTERKRAEEALRKSEERFRLAMDASSDGIWDWDVTTDNGYFSPAYYRMLGYERGDFPATGREWISRIHPDDLDCTFAMNQDCIENRCQSFEIEYRLKAKDGSWKWILGRGKVVSRDAEGRALRMIGTHVDITERKRAEEEILFKNAILSTQQETSPDGILIVDENAKIINFNQRFIELWNIPKTLLVSRIDEPVLQYITEQLKDPESFIGRVRYLYEHKYEKSFEELLLKDGRVIERFSSPMIGETGKYYGRVWYFRDITERKTAQEKNRSSEPIQ